MYAECRRRLELATRVLAVISTKIPVETSDELQLRDLVEMEDERSLPLPELACRVISREIRRSRALHN